MHLSCDEMIPADILVLRSSDRHGLCYIDTQNLDGEANLKQREVPRGFVENVSSKMRNENGDPINTNPSCRAVMTASSILHFKIAQIEASFLFFAARDLQSSKFSKYFGV